MGKVKEEWDKQGRQYDNVVNFGIDHFDTTGFEPRKTNPDEEWKENGEYPDGDKYDYDGEDDTNDEDIENRAAYANLGEQVPFDPEAAERAREEAKKNQAEEDKQ